MLFNKTNSQNKSQYEKNDMHLNNFMLILEHVYSYVYHKYYYIIFDNHCYSYKHCTTQF